MKHPPYKSFNDPVHGFVAVPYGLVMDLLQTPEVQRLRRIRQLGVGHMVFPGAEHSRFGHALGAMALMRQALETLRAKGSAITQHEETSALALALLHDVGHGPFSHTLEHELISGFSHELMSRELIVRLSDRMGGRLDTALEVFDNRYDRPFFHQLISSQLDVDRLDYLRRDAYYTGVAEGAVGVDRIVRNLRVWPEGDGGNIVVEQKGLHSVENFLTARRLMYWQVYLHKAVVAGDQLLRAVLRRARHLEKTRSSNVVRASPALRFFLENPVSREQLGEAEVVDRYVALDDSDILYSLKRWTEASDPVLSDLATRFLTRRFPRVTFLESRPSESLEAALRERVVQTRHLVARMGESANDDHVDYYFAVDRADHSAYESRQDSIEIVDANGRVRELSQMTDAVAVSALDDFETRWYVCVAKDVDTTGLL